MTTAMEAHSTVGYALARDEGEAFWLLGMLETRRTPGDGLA